MRRQKVEAYLEKLQLENLVISSDIEKIKDVCICELTYNSKEVTEATLFVCKGATFKKLYLEEAVLKGAALYVSEKKYDLNVDLPYIIVKDIRKVMALLADLFYDSPAQKINMVGITGTKGKTTTINYFKSIMDEYLFAQGKKESGILSTIETYDGKDRFASSLTTPEALEVYKHIRNAVDHDLMCLEMEVSSQALKYGRVEGVFYDIGIFTNISEDHISPTEHKDFEDYFQAKLRIFDQTKVAVINRNADCYERIKEAASKCERVITFGRNPECDIYGYNINHVNDKLHFQVRTKDFEQEIVLNIQGEVNVENALAAIGAASVLGIPPNYIQSGLEKTYIRGRMETYANSDRSIVAIVDYAHNRLSFEKLFAHAKDCYPDYRIVSIFGCPGGKAHHRREDLGSIAGKHSDMIYIVADDPDGEDVFDISKEIARYVEAGGCAYEIIEDRGVAIKKAIDSAAEPTLILVAGKGHEKRQKYGGKYIECLSDSEYVELFLK
jgi:UDP-N-acetylmuramyl-tripeptide synthetase